MTTKVIKSYKRMAKRPPPNTEPDETYNYETEPGITAYVVKKWGTGDDKAWDTRHFVGFGNAEPGGDGWEKGFGPSGRLLYRLPQLIAASNEEYVWIPEGEKDVETLVALGLVATTNPNGFEGWSDDFAEFFKGRKCIIVEDNDDASRKRTADIRFSIGKFAKSINVIRFEDMAEKSDATDFIQAGGTLDELIARIGPAYRPDEIERDKNGKVIASQRNIKLALGLLGVRLSRDEFQDRLLIDGLEGFGPALSDAALNRMRMQIDEKWHLSAAKDFFTDVVFDIAHQNSFHPVRDYLDSLQWDGVPRLDGWLHRYGGAKDDDYTKAIGALVLIAAVRRIRQPGCKFDEMLVLESDQGKNKSSALAILAKREDWFSDDLPLNADSQKVIERIAGRWIVEAAELAGMRKGEVEHMKSFLSRRIDRARMAYGRVPLEHPRQCVFIGTDNSGNYLRDSTGNRRIWPVRIEQFDLAALARDVDQLWAEASTREAAGESIRLDKTLWDAAAAEQEERRIDDPFVEVLQDRLGDQEGKISTLDLWSALGVEVEKRTQEQNARLGSVMKQLGFQRKKMRFGTNTSWAYQRGESQHVINAERPF
ncbi:VapE domain-containing protein [Devosia sp. ZW T5_3]|uniref:VapE domain-containing protein n=1 Tax=Devosia sp. ZW T5_3 TaxID=3378085 RepID=UPI003851C0FA